MFQRTATRLKRKLWWQNVKLWIILIAIILVILAVIISELGVNNNAVWVVLLLGVMGISLVSYELLVGNECVSLGNN